MSEEVPPSWWSAEIQEVLLSWLEKAYPAEGCGLILRDSAGREVFEACENVIDKYHRLDPEQYPRTSRDFYMIDPRAFLRAAEDDLEVVAIVHSHPDAGDYFSDADVAAALMPDTEEGEPLEPIYPGADYLVISVREGRAKAGTLYRFSGDDREQPFRAVWSSTRDDWHQ